MPTTLKSRTFYLMLVMFLLCDLGKMKFFLFCIDTFGSYGKKLGNFKLSFSLYIYLLILIFLVSALLVFFLSCLPLQSRLQT